ncbi:sugar phosphate isomerase/epimerase [soil metagenome]
MKNLIIIVLLFCFSEILAQKQALLDPESLGIVSYTFRDRFSKDVPGTLDKIKSLGITNIEFSNLFGKTAGELRKLLDERGMICTSYGVSYNDVLNKVAEVAENAKTLGAKYVRVASIPYEKPYTLEDAKRTVADFNKAGKDLKDRGLIFCYHNHGFEFQPWNNETLYDYIIQNTNPEYVSFEMDILWVVHPGQDPVKFLQKYPDRYRLMHVKDLKKGVKGDLSGSTPVENDVTLGTGQIDIPAVLKAAQNTKIEYFYIEDENPNVDEQVPQSIAYLKKFMK